MKNSWETRSRRPPTASATPVTAAVGNAWPARTRGAGGERASSGVSGSRAIATRLPRPELIGLIAIAGTLNLWALARNGWANQYYAAAVRSMSTSWHDFLYASMDKSGVMTIDKPPLALWVESLSVRVFGYHSLSLLVPEALMGVASVALVYDLVRRRFGRVGGFVAGLALATTPITVGISRHNNPDALLVLCSIAALWCAMRAFEAAPTGRSTRTLKGTPLIGAHPEGHRQAGWLVAAGVCVGLGFETKMGVALAVVPGIAAAWLWVAPAARGRWHALRQLLAGGGAMVLVGGAWPLLVELTPAGDRPWVSGTSDNRILSLIFEYNGLGRVDGQTGGPGGAGGGNMFGGTPGPLRLLNSALGGQAGWLLGFAAVSGLGLLAASRVRRADPRTGWLIAVGGGFAATAVLFSAASGIFHPYYVSLLAPFTAMLVGAGAAQILGRGHNARVVGPLAVLAGVITELIVRSRYPGQLTWLPAVLIAVGVLAVIALATFAAPRVRKVALAAALAALLLAPAIWAVDTLGYATSGTFPSGGPQNVATAGGSGFGGPGGGFGGRAGGGGFAGVARGAGIGGGGAGGVPLFGPGGSSTSTGGASARGASAGAPTGLPGGAGVPTGAPPGLGGSGRLGGGAGPGGAGGAGGGQFGSDTALTKVLAYVNKHGGGTIVVSSQSSAAQAIVEKGANVAGIGGFSGRESDVSVSWLAREVSAGKIRWVLAEEQGGGGLGGGSGRGLPRDTRAGAKAAIAAVEKGCQAVTLTSTSAGTGTAVASGTSTAGTGTLYDCQGRAAQL
jgi:4-amino-4-deoxy-L-arabinose transferase-like glycosyltransferase